MAFVACVVNGVFGFSLSLPPPYRTLVAVPAVPLIVCMACHAHRVMAVAVHFDDSADCAVTSTIRFAPSDKPSDGATQVRMGGTHMIP